MTLKKLEVFVIISIIAGIGIVYAFTQKPALAPTNNTAVINQTNQQQAVNNVIAYQGVDGKNALDLLKANHQVDLKHYSSGDMVAGIDGVIPDSKHFWSFYVNGQMAQVGASDYITKSSDQIKWQIDTVVDYTK